MQEITNHTLVHEQLISFYRGFKHDAHPMAIMVGVVGALAAFYPGAADIKCALTRSQNRCYSLCQTTIVAIWELLQCCREVYGRITMHGSGMPHNAC